MSSYFNDEEDELYDNADDEEEEEDEEEYVSKSSVIKPKKKIEKDDDEIDEGDEGDEGDEEDYDEIIGGAKEEEEDYEDNDDENNDDELDEDEDEDVDDDNEDLELDEEKEDTQKPKKVKQLPQNVVYNDDDDDDDDDGETYLKKFDKDIHKNYIMNFHPECVMHNYDEIEGLSKVVRDQNGIIVDDLHRTLPYLTKYERTRILGQRAKQINSGATPFVKVPENVIDGYLVAELELKQKRIPFIIRRPLPNGGSEYWNIKDLENIAF
jgi:DNA-directed RNA polymerase subunit K/omega